jgi:hypothetical protein
MKKKFVRHEKYIKIQKTLLVMVVEVKTLECFAYLEVIISQHVLIVFRMKRDQFTICLAFVALQIKCKQLPEKQCTS